MLAVVAPIPVEAPEMAFSDSLLCDSGRPTADHDYRVLEYGKTRTCRFEERHLAQVNVISTAAALQIFESVV